MYFFKCKHCGKMVMLLDKPCCQTICCGEPMEELVPNTVDAAQEKHVPVVKEEDGFVTVQVGEVMHPMLDAHYIGFILVHTDQGYKIKHLKPGMVPEAKFALLDNEVVFSAYEYCNLHGLWKKSVE